MGKKKIVSLSAEKRAELERGYRKGRSHTFRQRCQMVLLKSEERTSSEVAGIVRCCEIVINNWVKRYETEGIKGLETRAGRGRPPILSQQNAAHLQQVKDEIKKHPNSVKTVVAVLADDLDLVMHPETLKRFLKKMVIASVAPERGSNRGKWLPREKAKKKS